MTIKIKKIFFASIVVLAAAFVLLPFASYAAEGDPSPIDTSPGAFVALTSIPGIQEAADSGDIAMLLNTLYRLCIGAAAIIAVVQIVRGGITYMLGDSVTEKRDARKHIGAAIIGLVLVLSPYLVFSIIDPRILDLSVDVSELKPTDRANPSTSGGGTGGASCTDNNLKQRLQTSYNQMRQAQPNGTIFFDATGDTTGACCVAITTTGNSQACTYAGDRCSCTTSNPGAFGDPQESAYVPTRVFVSYNVNSERSVRFYLDVNENRFSATYASQAACTADRLNFLLLLQNIKSSALFCATSQQTNPAECRENIPKIKSGDIEPTAATLSTVSQTCTEVRR